MKKAEEQLEKDEGHESLKKASAGPGIKWEWCAGKNGLGVPVLG